MRKIEISKKAFYDLVGINSDIARIIGQLSEAGHKILIISSHSYECAKEIGDCLKGSKVPFDKLCLCSKSEKPSQFKLKTIERENCDLYIEDQERVVNFLRECLDHCQVVHYKNHQSLTELEKLLKI